MFLRSGRGLLVRPTIVPQVGWGHLAVDFIVLVAFLPQ